jgi:4-hydroxybenzoyl-CoA reductase subunit beta
MMRLPRFAYASPRSLVEAVAMVADGGPEVSVVAGGTDLFPNMKRRQQTPRRVVGLRLVPELRAHHGGGKKELTLGAMTSLTGVENDVAVKEAWPALARAAQLISTPPLRNMGTLGGNLCLDTRCNYYDQNYEWRKAIDFCMKKDGEVCWVAPGSPRCWAVSSSDTAPVLCAIGAEVTLVSRAGERRIPVTELFADDGIRYLSKKPEEILSAVHLPSNHGRRVLASYRKLRRRESFDFPVLGIAAAARLAADGTVEWARLVVGGTGSRPHEAPEAAARLVGRRLDDAEAVKAAAQAAAQLARPLDNTDFVMGWRKHMARDLAAKAILDLGALALP